MFHVCKGKVSASMLVFVPISIWFPVLVKVAVLMLCPAERAIENFSVRMLYDVNGKTFTAANV